MKVDADGPLHGGVVQFANWPWPGICMKGDRAISLGNMLKRIARRLRDDEMTMKERCDLAGWLEAQAEDLQKCRVYGPL